MTASRSSALLMEIGPIIKNRPWLQFLWRINLTVESNFNQFPESVNFNHENLPNSILNRFNITNSVENLVATWIPKLKS